MNKFLKSVVLAMAISITSISTMAANIGENTHYIDTTGEVYTVKSSRYKENGAWNGETLYGYDNESVRTTNEAGATAVWTDYPQKETGKLEFYVWKSVIPGGDPEVLVEVQTNMGGRKKTIDCSVGYSGWERIAVLDVSDVFMTTTLTASGKGIMPTCAIKFVKTDEDEYKADRIFDNNNELMVVKNNSSKCLYNGKYLKFEDVTPTIMNNNMMIPLRFVTENMGAEVLWNGADRSVTINKDGQTVIFHIDSTSYTVNGVAKSLDQPPVISNSRTLVPLRAMSEGLGNEVEWNDNGVVCIGKNVSYDDKKNEYINALGVVLSR